MKKSLYFLGSILVLGILSLNHELTAQSGTKPRLIITADPELDDNNSLIRLILYSTDFQIEGLVYASSQFHWKGDGKGTKWFVPGREYDRFNMGACPCTSWRWEKGEKFIHNIVEAYAKSYQNLKIHNKEYPTPEYLRSKIRYGNIEFDGDYSKDTPGSELIRTLILDDKPGPLYITAWGGASTIARALKNIQNQYEFTAGWPEIYAKVSKKVILLPSGDQDDTYATYIKPNWPAIEYRRFRDSPNYGYGAQLRAKDENKPFLTPIWMTANITSKGPLGSLYRVWGDGKTMVKGDMVDYFGLSGYSTEELKKMGYFVWMPPQEKGSWLGEGDNHTFMNMLGNGLRAYEKGSFGGWGGREILAKSSPDLFSAAETTADQMASQMGNSLSVKKEDDMQFPDFFSKAQNSFAARMQWAVTPTYKGANHEPKVQIQGPMKVMANVGQKVKIYSDVTDLDGDGLSVKWWQIPVGYANEPITITKDNNNQAEILVPKNARPGQEFHIILEVEDNGKPALTSYARVIIEVREK